MYLLPIPEPLWQVAPRNARAITVQNRFNKQSIVLCGYAHMAFPAGEQVSNSIPLVVAQAIAAHRSASESTDRLRIIRILIWESAN